MKQTHLRDAKYVVIDAETTGLVAGRDRIVELALAHVDADGPPRIVFSSLIDPQRTVLGTEVHGLTSVELAGAPKLGDVLGDITRAVAGRIVVGHHVEFDLRFLEAELMAFGLTRRLPHICTMWLRVGLGGPRQTLGDACRAEGVPLRRPHAATDDASLPQSSSSANSSRARAGSWRPLRTSPSPSTSNSAGASTSRP